MDIGTTLPAGCTDGYRVSPAAHREWVSRADEAGFAGLWALDHIVKPDTYTTSVLHPLISLSHAAAITESIPLGTSILLLPLRRAATTAHAALSLRYLADRDLTLGLGAGQVPDEFAVTGVPIEQRGPRLSEGIEVLQELFSGQGTYHSQFHAFDDVTIDPVLDESPRLLAGGSSAYTDGPMPEPMLDRIVAAGGWIAPPLPPAQAAADWETIRAHAETVGIEPGTLDRVALTYCYVVETEDQEQARDQQREAFGEFYSSKRGFEYAREHCLTGTVSDVHQQLGAYETSGFDQVIVGTPAHARDDLATQMELLTAVVLDR